MICLAYNRGAHAMPFWRAPVRKAEWSALL